MITVSPKQTKLIKNDNLSNLKPMNGKGSTLSTSKTHPPTDISDTAKSLNEGLESATQGEHPTPPVHAEEAASTATSIAKTLAKIPVLPIAIPSENKDSKKLADKISDKSSSSKISFIKKVLPYSGRTFLFRTIRDVSF